MILLTGGAGFIGSALLHDLNERGRSDIYLVDSFGSSEKWKNISSKRIDDYCHKNRFPEKLENGLDPGKVDCIFHLGACSSTTETNIDYLMENNFLFSRLLAEFAIKNRIPFIYASSAATYGDGSQGFDDDGSRLETLRPLNGYAYSKHLFDLWISKQKPSSQVLGLKFFNVFGPNEYHKGEMKSVPFKAYHEITEKKSLSLFRSNHPDYRDGEQKRDFIYVKDVVSIMLECQEKAVSGIYNLGTGTASTWNELALAAFKALSVTPDIQYTPLPEQLKDKYQYYTCANMNNLRKAGITHTCMNLENSIRDYYSTYLDTTSIYL